jgi:TRAP-type C4-dicarboxylate transport system permease small subunit
MGAFQGVGRISRMVGRFTGWVGIVLLGLMFVILLLQVFCRYVLNHSLPWPEEVAVVFSAWLGFLGASIAVRERMHVGFTAIIDSLSRRKKAFFMLFIDGLIGFFGGYLLLYGWKIAVFVWDKQKTPFTDIPYFYLYISIAIGGGLFIVHSLALIIENLRILAGAQES